MTVKVVVEVNFYEHVTYDNVEFYQGAESKRVTMYHLSLQGNTPFVYYHLYRLRTDSHDEIWQFL